MKSLTLLLILFIIETSISKIELDNYSIDIFIIKMKNDGIFDILVEFKYIYGPDVAIISCEELNRNCEGNCKRLVTEYMPDFARSKAWFGFEEDEDEDEDEDKDKDKNKDKDKDKDKNKNKDKDDHSDVSPIDTKTSIQNILKKKYAPNEADYFSDKIIKRAQELNINI